MTSINELFLIFLSVAMAQHSTPRLRQKDPGSRMQLAGRTKKMILICPLGTLGVRGGTLGARRLYTSSFPPYLLIDGSLTSIATWLHLLNSTGSKMCVWACQRIENSLKSCIMATAVAIHHIERQAAHGRQHVMMIMAVSLAVYSSLLCYSDSTRVRSGPTYNLKSWIREPVGVPDVYQGVAVSESTYVRDVNSRCTNKHQHVRDIYIKPKAAPGCTDH